MSEMMAGLTARATALGVPLTAHVDLTYRCNERCEHCYLDHEDHGELTFAEVSALLTQLAEAGTLFLTLSGDYLGSCSGPFRQVHSVAVDSINFD